MSHHFDTQFRPLFDFTLALLSDAPDDDILSALAFLAKHKETQPVHLIEASSKLMRDRPALYRAIPAYTKVNPFINPMQGLSLLVFFGGKGPEIATQLAVILHAQDTLPEDAFVSAVAMVERHAPAGTRTLEAALKPFESVASVTA